MENKAPTHMAPPPHIRRIKRPRRSTRGQIMLIVLAAAVVLGITVFSLMGVLPMFNRFRAQVRNEVDQSALLGSALEYMVFAIRQQWYLEHDSGAPRIYSPASDLDYFTDADNTARFTLSDRARTDPQYGVNVRLGRPLNDLDATLGVIANNQNDVGTTLGSSTSWVRVYRKNLMTTGHPLYVLMDYLRARDDIKGLRYTISRVTNVHYPQGDRVIFLKIRVDLEPTSPGALLFGTSPEVFTEAVVGFFPRTVAEYALITPGRIRTDKPYTTVRGTASNVVRGNTNAAIEKSDLLIPAISDQNKKGRIQMLSPVLALGDLVVPAVAATGAAQLMSGIVFGSTLTLGIGTLTEQGSDGALKIWSPLSAGGINDTLYDQLASRIAIRSGIATDTDDEGLRAIFDVTQAATVANAFQTCVKHQAVLTDLIATAKSALVIKESAPVNRTIATEADVANFQRTSSTMNFNLALTEGNFFAPQSVPGFDAKVWVNQFNGSNSAPARVSGSPGFSVTSSANAPPPVMHVKVGFARIGQSNTLKWNVEADMPADGWFSFKLDSGDVTALTNARNAVQSDLNDLNAQLASDRQKIADMGGNPDGDFASVFTQNLLTAQLAYRSAILDYIASQNPPPTPTPTPSGTTTEYRMNGDTLEGVVELFWSQLVPEAKAAHHHHHHHGQGQGQNPDIPPTYLDVPNFPPNFGHNGGHLSTGINCSSQDATVQAACDAWIRAAILYGLAAHRDSLNSQIADKNAELIQAQLALDYAQFPFEVKVATQAQLIGGYKQPDLEQLVVTTQNEETLKNSLGLVMSISVVPFDVGSNGVGATLRRYTSGNHTHTCDGSADQGDPDSGDTCTRSSRLQVDTTWDSAGLRTVANLTGGYQALNPTGPVANIGTPPDGVTNVALLYDQCSQSSPPVSYLTKHPELARFVWNFRPLDPADNPPTELVLDENNSTYTSNTDPADTRWRVHAIVNTCRIKEGATLVTGFLVCLKTIIEPRASNNPLEIIGTIVTLDMDIDPSAIEAGITWMTIYHPNAPYKLWRSGWLGGGQNCLAMNDPATLAADPIWNPVPSLPHLARQRLCSVHSIAGQYPTPFTWTMFDPVCFPEGAKVTCTFHDEKYNAKIMSVVTRI